MRLQLILLTIALFLSGCAVQKVPKPIENNWQTKLDAVQHWKANGKVAFFSPQERHSVNFVWHNKQPDTHFDLTLTSFIGTQVLALSQTADTSILEYEGETYQASNTQKMLWQLTGLSLPVTQAPHWLKGRPNSEISDYDDLQRITAARITDDNNNVWQISYSKYKMFQGFWLPTQLKLTHQQLKIKMQIHSWQLNL